MKKNSVELRMELKAVSPIAIIENNVNEPNGNIVTKVKRTAVVIKDENGEDRVTEVGYLPANGIRGNLRRLATKKLVQAVKENEGITELKDSDLHAMLSGSGASHSALTVAQANEVREKNPILSVFGTGLLLQGKLKMSDARPKVDEKSWQLIKRFSFVKVDDVLMGTKYANLFSKEQIENWEKSVADNSEARRKDRENKKLAKESGEVFDESTKTKKSSIQHFAQKEYIASQTKFFSCFSIENATELEVGMLLHSLKDFVDLGRVGSSQNIGFGVVDIKITDEDDTISIERVADEEYIFSAKKDMSLTGDFKKAYDAYEAFLKTATRDNIEIISKF